MPSFFPLSVAVLHFRATNLNLSILILVAYIINPIIVYFQVPHSHFRANTYPEAISKTYATRGYSSVSSTVFPIQRPDSMCTICTTWFENRAVADGKKYIEACISLGRWDAPVSKLEESPDLHPVHKEASALFRAFALAWSTFRLRGAGFYDFPADEKLAAVELMADTASILRRVHEFLSWYAARVETGKVQLDHEEKALLLEKCIGRPVFASHLIRLSAWLHGFSHCYIFLGLDDSPNGYYASHIRRELASIKDRLTEAVRMLLARTLPQSPQTTPAQNGQHRVDDEPLEGETAPVGD